MNAKVAFKLGEVTYQLEVNEPKEMDTLHKMIVLANPPRYCHVCHNTEHFRLDTNKDQKGNTYINVMCLAKGCRAKAKLGQYQTGGYFWHKFEEYVKPGSDAAATSAPSAENIDTDDIPF